MITGTDIAVTVPNGSDLTMLTPTIVSTGASVNPTSGSLVDFSGGPVQFTVTAADNSTAVYTVTVTEAPSSAKEITSFEIAGAMGMITGTDIAVTVPNGSDLTMLTPTIVSTGTSVNPMSGSLVDFSGGPVQFTVTAADNSTTVYTVTVTEALSSAKEITSFEIDGAMGMITGTDIAVTVPNGSDLTMLTPTISSTGASVNPMSGSLVDFSGGPVQFTVTAADNSTEVYTVTVTEMP